MKMTILLGNGFDVALGLRTKYSQFIKYYKASGQLEYKIDKITKSIKENEELWSNVELQLGAVSNDYNDKEINQYLDDANDLITCFQKYIQTQNDRFVLESKTNIELFLEKFKNIKNYVYSPEKTQLNKLDFNNPYILNFYFFNYTDTLLKLLDFRSENMIYDIPREPNRYTKYKVHYIHGKLDDAMVVGVNDSKQILNSSFSNNQKVQNMLIKKRYMDGCGNTEYDNLKNDLSNSNLLIIYGMSIGQTDKRYWELVVDSLLKNPNLYVLIFSLNKSYSSASALYYKNIEFKEQIIADLLKNIPTSSEINESIKSRIIVTTKTNLFSDFEIIF